MQGSKLKLQINVYPRGTSISIQSSTLPWAVQSKFLGNQLLESLIDRTGRSTTNDSICWPTRPPCWNIEGLHHHLLGPGLPAHYFQTETKFRGSGPPSSAMDFIKKRKLRELLDGLGSRADKATSSSSLASESDTVLATDSSPVPAARRSVDPTMPPQTPPSNVSTIRTPGSDSMPLRYSLSSIARPSNTLANTSADADLLAKRRRLGLHNAPSKDFGSSSPASTASGPTTISNVVLRKWPGHTADKKPLFQPKYCPGDRDELLKRLATFQELTDWTPKPDSVNEVQWARRGWICNGKERVRCTLCNKELVVKLNKKEVDGKEVAVLVASEIEEAMVQKYLELMVTSHGEDCLWRKRGCEESLLRLSLSNRQNAISDLRKRYDALCARNAFLPYEFNLRLPQKLNIDTVLSQLPPDFFTVPAPAPNLNNNLNRVALVLAIFGWESLDNARIGPVPNSASCHTCLRRLGLWMFKSKEIDPETNTVLVPAPMDHLDPVREHRFFCPWKSAEAQSLRSDASSTRRMRLAAEEEAMAGWEVLLQVIKNEAYLRGRDNPTSKKGAAAGSPQTPRRSGFGGGQDQNSPYGSTPGGDDGADDEEDEKAQGELDQQRRNKLRKLRNLLSGSGANKLRKSLSRPGTSHSTHQEETTTTGNDVATERPPTAEQKAT